MVHEQQAFSIYTRALDLPEDKREAFLEDTCANDSRLRQEVRLLLEAADEAGAEGFLEQPVDVLTAAADSHSENADAKLGQRIGRYQLREVLGEGGFGAVYRAEQLEPVRREVALKLIRHHLPGAELIRRFEVERQLLASLNHSGIAQMYDAGATGEGVPYLVMELVSGEPVSAYCIRNNLSTAARVRLFMQVCDAVQYAHQNGVIHRDLKPSNILVSETGGKPLPKIIDFGIASVTADKGQTPGARSGQGMAGSPEYMSPEQVRGRNPDTRSDVYSLGILLFELLCDKRPFGGENVSLTGLLAQVTDQQAPAPSEVCEPAKAALLREDLDWVVLKAIEKQPQARYDSVSALLADLARWEAKKPVEARPASAAYRTRKFVSRHRLSVAAAAVLLIMLLVAVAGTSIGMLKAQKAAASAQQTVLLLQEFLAAPDPQEKGRELKVVEMLEQFAPRLMALGDRPLVQASVMNTYASTYQGLGLFADARSYAEQAYRIRVRELGDSDPMTLASANRMAQILIELGAAEDALEWARRAHDDALETFGPGTPVTLAYEITVAEALHKLGQFEQAEEIYARVMPLQSSQPPGAESAVLHTMNRRALNYQQLGRHDDSEKLARQAYELTLAQMGADHPDTLNAASELAYALGEAGQFEAAGELHSQVLESRRRVLGPEHRKTLISQVNAAWIDYRLGHYESAEALNREALVVQERVLGETNRDTIATRANLAMVLARQGDLDAAESLMGTALQQRRDVLGEDHPETLVALNDMIVVYARQGKYQQAAGLAEQLAATNRQVQGAEHPATLSTLNNLGWLLNRLGEPDRALPVITEAWQGRVNGFGPEHPSTLGSQQTLAEVLLGLGRTAEALEHFESLVEASNRVLGEDHRQAMARQQRLAEVRGDNETDS